MKTTLLPPATQLAATAAKGGHWLFAVAQKRKAGERLTEKYLTRLAKPLVWAAPSYAARGCPGRRAHDGRPTASAEKQLKHYEPLLVASRQQMASGAVLRTPAVAALAAARTARKRLAMRVPNRQDDLPALVKTYRKTRVVVEAGHGPKPAA